MVGHCLRDLDRQIMLQDLSKIDEVITRWSCSSYSMRKWRAASTNDDN